jgi:hypothetical protein
MSTVVVERSFPEPTAYEDLAARAARVAWCFEAYGVRLLGSYASGDGRRMVCVYDAPDAEAVRQVQRQAGAPYDRIWVATAVPPAGGAAIP